MLPYLFTPHVLGDPRKPTRWLPGGFPRILVMSVRAQMRMPLRIQGDADLSGDSGLLVVMISGSRIVFGQRNQRSGETWVWQPLGVKPVLNLHQTIPAITAQLQQALWPLETPEPEWAEDEYAFE